MSDIRSFFAPKSGSGKSSGDGDKSPPPKKVSKAETDELDRAIRKSAKRASGDVVNLDDSDEDDSPPAKSSKSATPQKQTPKATPKKEEKKVVDAADFFGSKKVKQTAPPPRKERDPTADNVKIVTKDKKSKKKKEEEPVKKGGDDEFDDEFGDDFDIPDDLLDASTYSQNPQTQDTGSVNASASASASAPVAAERQRSASPAKPATPADKGKRRAESPEKKPSPAKRPIEKSPASEVIDLDAEEDEVEPPAKKAKIEDKVASPSPVVKADVAGSPEPRASGSASGTPSQKSTFLNAIKERPKAGRVVRGAEGCLTGLTFVFTGDFTQFSRAEAEDIVRRYNGKVTGSVSSRTSYLVVGTETGRTKTSKAEEVNTPQMTEEAFIAFVEKAPAKKIPVPTPPKGKSKKAAPIINPATKGDTTAMLWTDKYAPKALEDLVGNPGIKDKLKKWLGDWSTSSEFKAALLSGPPGIGKTSMAHLVAKSEGFNPVEFNASDARSKKILQAVVSGLTANHSMSEYLIGGGLAKGKHDLVQLPHKTVLIMDEVDGMSGGDRGGSTELIMMIRKTQVPIICICNDRQSTKVRTLSKYCLDLKFRRPDASQVMKRLLPIAKAEGLDIQPNVIEELAKVSQSDIRQVLNLLSMYRVSKSKMSYDDAMNSDKQPTWSIWDLVPKLFRGQEYEHTSLSDKMDLYFYDYSFLPLMVQENYLRCTQPNLARGPPGMQVTPSQMQVRLMELMSQAADSISDGDLIDNTMRSTNNWSVMPLHSIASCVRPAYFMHGNIGQPNFPATLGNMSKSGKNFRLLKELQLHMRLHISGDKTDVRQSYLPSLLPRITKPLIDQGAAGVPEVIDTMDVYWLTKEDWQSVHDLNLGEDIVAKVQSTTKAAFTREYNKATHPMPFITQSATKVKAGGPKPDMDDVIDLEENLDEEDDGSPDASGEDDDNGSGDDVKNDKIISKKGAKGAKGGKSGAAPNARGGGSGSRGGSSSGGRGSRGGKKK